MFRRLRFALGYDTPEDRQIREIQTNSRRTREIQTVRRVEREITKISSDNPERDTFIEMGKYIMGTSLEAVMNKFWIQKGDCNIFLIGENHQQRNFKCIGINEMFTTLIQIIEKVDIKPPIDIMLEIKQNQVHDIRFKPPDMLLSRWGLLLGNPTTLQINQVRNLLGSCIYKANHCPVKVHWSDSNGMLPYANQDIDYTYSLDHFPVARAYEAYPSRMKDITNLPFGSPNEIDIPDDEIVDFLTHHLILKKEIEKAEKVNPSFTMDFSKTIFKEFIKQVNAHAQSDHLLFKMRYIIDFYTSARIIAKGMKNVIVYGGDVHIQNVVHILSKLDYNIVQHSTNVRCL